MGQGVLLIWPLPVRSELENPKVVKDEQSQRRIGAAGADLACLTTNAGFDRQCEDFTGATVTGARSAHQCFNNLLRLFIRRDDFNAHLLPGPVNSQRPPLSLVPPAPETASFHDGHSGEAF